MQTITVIYCILALLLSLFVAYFQYFFKQKKKAKIDVLLFVLKTVSLFLLLLLLINPAIKNVENENTKPVLAVLVDDSKSISFFKEDKSIQEFLEALQKDKSIVEKFNVEAFSFGNKITLLDSLSFLDGNTNVYKAISTVNQLYEGKIAPIVVLSDGNQTVGNDYEFINAKQKIYPVVFGDTVLYKDLKISQLNVNKYSYIKNKFPVEVLLNYEGKENVTSQFSIVKKGKTIFTKKVQFSATNNSKTITTNLTSTKEGLQYYTASIRKIEGEKNTKNNTKSFSVEVINEQTKVLVLTSVLHPDLGALKKSIESNKQRSVSVFLVDEFKNQINDYQLIILYQPNNSFNKIINDIKTSNSNYFLISGANSDWNFINKNQLGISKNALRQTENYGALFSNSFLTFLQKDIGFNQFSPLKDQFGEVSISREHQTLLFQNINGLETKQPLLATLEINNQKSAILFGEGLWRWRSASFLNSNSFQDFDTFIGNLVQYLASTKKRNRLEVAVENLYSDASVIDISAFYLDKNYQFDARASLEISVTNTGTKKVIKVPFSLMNNSYQTEIENLGPGDYSYTVSVIGQQIKKHGKFKVTENQIEEQFTNANSTKLLKLAEKTGGKLYFKDEVDKLKKEILADKSFYTTQKSIIREQSLIDWKWVLFTVITLFTVEWFVRKYYGKI
ncbi:vWA domain-containing protein [Polaribacter butkevichii]|uniref:VWA domain-containing protein n=1 Tax=Polaribacter butkevichii TaxID=218490 RepID=UPI001FE724D9|nr:VWA domain-containing protein [Polaribacter butkevichii]